MSLKSPPTTRFAPSPNGFLHLGHAYAAMVAHEAGGGHFLLRMEDLDTSRARPAFETAIFEDLRWLGLDWTGPVLKQSERFAIYAEALARLRDKALLYPCFCTRRDIVEEVARSGNAPHGPEGPLYPGTCRRLAEAEREDRMAAGATYSLRLDVARASEMAGPLTWRDVSEGEQTARPELLGDVVLARKDVPASYHLAVVVDDAAQGVTRVTRGRDLFEATHMHRLLQALLDLPVPQFHHHGLVVDETGARLSKRAASLAIRALRDAGETPERVKALAYERLELVRR